MRALRPWAYITVALALLALALTGPHAWATPDAQGGTIPTARPSATYAPPTPIITVAPEPTQPPQQPTQAPTQGPTQAPGIQPTAVVQPAPASPLTPAPSSPLVLAVVTYPRYARPGATLQLTATLSNRGSAPLADVSLDLYLSDGLSPLPQKAGQPGEWSAQTLHAAATKLDARGQLVVPFSITVDRSAQAGSVLQVMGVGRAAGIDPVLVQTLIAMPPAELPATGGFSPGMP